MLRYFVVALSASAVWLAFHLYSELGLSHVFMKHHPGKCRRVDGQYLGSEDFAVTSGGLAFITSGGSQSAFPAAYHQYLQDNNIWGRILLFNFIDPNPGAILLKIKDTTDFDPKTFRPHGISLVEDEVKGEHLLYVINHADPDVVEKFRFIPNTKMLIHMKTIPLPGITISNDLVMLGEDRFYITNFLTYETPIMIQMELMIPLSLGGVFLNNGSGLTEVVPRLNLPNGIVMSQDHRFVYVALSMDKSVLVLSRQADDRLVRVQTAHLNAGPDNLQHLGHSLLVGAHPIGYKMVFSMSDPRNRAPSSVVKLPLEQGLVVGEQASDYTEVFYDHGDLISLATVAYLRGDKLLIGSLVDTLVLCDVCTHHSAL